MLHDAAIPTLLAGFAFGALSLLSIGPNNILLLREGLGGRRPLLVASLMFLSYVALLSTAVVAGHSVGPVVQDAAPLLGWGGAIVLALMGAATLRASARPAPDIRTVACGTETWRAATARVLKVVWLNPLTYLELVAIPAALALPLDGFEQRGALLAGLLLAFALNCFGFTLGASLLSPVFGRPSHLLVFDRVSGCVMIGLAVFAMTHAIMHPSALGTGTLAMLSEARAMPSMPAEAATPIDR